jgi:hypothetical protein
MTQEHKFVFDVMLATLHMPGPDISIADAVAKEV